MALNRVLALVIFKIICTGSKPIERDTIGFPDIRQSIGAPIAITRLADSPYLIYRQSATWHEAGEICSSHSRKLATFKKEEDYDTLALQLYALSNQNSSQDEFKINRRYWIGLNDIEKPGLWRWNRDIQPALVNKWSKGEKPNHNSSNNSSSDCVIMWNPLRNLHLWKDEPCSNKYYFICEDCETCF